MAFDLAQTALDPERRLLAAETRSDPEAVARLLHADFVEHWSSGRRWERHEIIAALAVEDGSQHVIMTEPSTMALGDDAVLVTYRSSRGARDAWRSSVWMMDDGRCQIVFHQATPIPPTPASDRS